MRFYHQCPLPEDVRIEDVAHGLSKQCRFAGQVDGEDVIYSVAEHSVRVSYIRPWEFPLWKLLHDGSEAYYHDVNRPLKYSPGMEAYRKYELLGLSAVCQHFGLEMPEPPEVKAADKIMLVTEKRDLFYRDDSWALNKMDDAEGVKPLPERIIPWSPRQAKNAFLMRYYEITGVNAFYPERG